MGYITFDTADESDDRALREILRGNPVDGRIQVAFQRNPSYFHALQVQGRVNQVMVARDVENHAIIALGTRSIKPVYINGCVRDAGYLSGLRINRDFRGGTVLARGYRYLRELHREKPVPIYTMTIIDDDRVVRELLTSERCGLPSCRDFGVFKTAAVTLIRKKKPLETDIIVERGAAGRLNEILACLNRNGIEKQFYPFYAKEDFTTEGSVLRGLHLHDISLALRNKRVVGVAAKWDQSRFKQILVTGYAGRMKLFKPLYNTVSRMFGFPPLPEPLSEVNYFYLGLIAVDDNDPRIFRALLREIHNEAIQKEYNYFLVGLHSLDPLLEVVDEYQHITYNSRLYVVCWDDGEEFCKRLDGRIPYLELGTL